MVLKYYLAGLATNLVTGFDDVITRIPVIASVAHSRLGKLAFSIGVFFAIILAIIVAVFFSSLLDYIPYHRYISAGLLFILAGCIWSGCFAEKRAKKTEARIKKITAERFFQLLAIGFVAAFASAIDDIVAYSALFINNNILMSSLGILTATLLELAFVIFFSKQISRVPHKEKIASVGLVVLGVLVATSVL